MKALIIGAGGQLGTTLVQTASLPMECLALDLPEIDITSWPAVEAVVQAQTPDVIINASAYTAVDRAEEEPGPAFRVNADGPQHLARAARRTGCRLIHVSTDYVFDGTAGTPYTPDAACRPLGVYGRSKQQGEANVRTIVKEAVIIRTSWLYSRFGSNFVVTMLRLMNEKVELRVVADQIGSPTWASTLAGAVWTAAGNPALSGTYHWSDAGVASWYDFAVAIQEEAMTLGLLARKIPIHPVRTDAFPTPAKRPAYSVLDCTRTWRDFAIDPLHWRVGLRRMLTEMVGFR